jgi:hypothetical protein
MLEPQMHAPSADELLRLALDDTDDNWMQLHAFCEVRANAELFLQAIHHAPASSKGQLVQWCEALRDLHPDLVGGIEDRDRLTAHLRE